MTSNNRSRPFRTVTRRNVLKGAAGLAMVGTAAGSLRPTLAQEASPITIAEPKTTLPTDDVSFRWVDSGDAKAFFWREFFPKYNEAHPNIQMDYQGLPWNEIQTVVPLGIQNGNAPDVFQIPQNVPPPLAFAEGWGAALDDVIPDLEEIKARFPAGSFVNGINIFEGKTYVLPLTSNRRHGSLLLYNRDYLGQAGLDPATTPFTWDTFRDAARVLTEQGAGEYYGLIFEGAQTGRFAEWANAFAALSGLKLGMFTGAAPIDWTTGEFLFTRPEIKAAIELLLAIRDDGSIFPGSASLNAPEARARVPQGASAMIIQGPWNVSQWRNESPDFNFGVAQTPVTSLDVARTYHVGPGGSNPIWVFADSPNKEVAGDILSYISSLEGQTAWASLVGVADAPILEEALAAAGSEDAEVVKTTSIFSEEIRLAPDPRVRNPETSAIYQAIQPVQPDFGTTIQGMFAGQISDIDGALQGLQDAWNAELERAIGAAKQTGAQVSRDDFAFANWDPTTDYTADDYSAL